MNEETGMGRSEGLRAALNYLWNEALVERPFPTNGRWRVRDLFALDDPLALDIDAALANVEEPGLDAAWKEAEAALPEGVGLSLHKLALDDWAEAVAEGSGLNGIQFVEQGETPVRALRLLAAVLRGECIRDECGGAGLHPAHEPSPR